MNTLITISIMVAVYILALRWFNRRARHVQRQMDREQAARRVVAKAALRRFKKQHRIWRRMDQGMLT